MKIGVLKERKDGEDRVALTPADCAILIGKGYTVLIEKGAGEGCNFSNEAYTNIGCYLAGREVVWRSGIVVKVKEPEKSEYKFFHKGSHLLCFLHFAGTPGLKEALDQSGMKYTELESLESDHSPLKEMGTIAGEEAWKIAEEQGFGENSPVCVVGMGSVGQAAASAARAAGADVFTYDLHNIKDLVNHIQNYRRVILAAYNPLKRAPIVVTEDMVKRMPFGSIIVDVSIDQGGNCETSIPTKHSNPTYMLDGVIHYCVPNIPGRVPLRASLALSEAILVYLLTL